ncbi:MAG: penicillin-binding protein 2 [Bacteroidetes bacterium]|nr:penicillin-binding protein 2 [Bacteroidota bacterium]MCL5034097.1 penicillin-binding protein 2 [Bacteroidota bacterium]
MFDAEFGSRSRSLMMRGVVVLALLGIGIKLGDMQLVNEVIYGKKSEDITTRIFVQQPLRGEIFDRYGNVMVENGPAYEVSVIPNEFKSDQIGPLANLLQMDSVDIARRIKIGIAISPYLPVRLKRDISFAALSAIEEHLKDFSGVYFDIQPKRVYVGKAKAAHILGFTKEISEQQLETLGDYYQPGDIVGYNGLEASYETILRGQKGYKYLAVNAQGQVVGSYDDGRLDVPSQDGDDLYLSVDEGLQAMAESLMVGRRGAVVALDPNNGQVLAMTSAPDFNPSVFSGYTSRAEWNKLINDPDHPLFNRATMAALPPGSTFKMVLATAALEGNVIDTNWTVHCTGSMLYGGRVFHCDKAHGTVNIIRAIEVSCNVFFYNLMLKVGFQAWTKYGRMYGFGEKTGIDLQDESPGIMPSEQYFNQIFGKDRWTNGYLLSLAIGQGEVSATPLQMAAYVMAISNFGKYYQPHLVRFIKNQRTGKIYYTQYSERTLPISREVLDKVREGMYYVVNGDRGTGVAARIPGVTVAGKTGTAQNPHGKDHAWFVAFAPFDHPKIAMAVLVENAGYGGAVAAPIARQLIQYYLNERKTVHEVEPSNGIVADAAVR